MGDRVAVGRGGERWSFKADEAPKADGSAAPRADGAAWAPRADGAAAPGAVEAASKGLPLKLFEGEDEEEAEEDILRGART